MDDGSWLYSLAGQASQLQQQDGSEAIERLRPDQDPQLGQGQRPETISATIQAVSPNL